MKQESNFMKSPINHLQYSPTITRITDRFRRFRAGRNLPSCSQSLNTFLDRSIAGALNPVRKDTRRGPLHQPSGCRLLFAFIVHPLKIESVEVSREVTEYRERNVDEKISAATRYSEGTKRWKLLTF